ncbi:MAG TPA: LPS assembly lipoprotein LptE [Steroidobacteraceae bacterium]|nr:LPS assembly lipoprotein LptE [Steroidobacteraceae bacterium]
MSSSNRQTALAAAALAAALGLLAACGFRLAGSEPLPAAMARPYLSFTDPYTDFARDFARELRAAGAQLQAAPGRGATATVEVSRDSVEQRVLSVSARNIPTEYLLVYTVTYSVQGAAGQLLAPQTISLTQDYSFSEQALLAKEHEAHMLRREMARDLAAIAIRRIASLK